MSDLLTLVPLALLLLVPLWIPLFAAAVGTVHDRLRPATLSPAQAAVDQAKQRARAARTARVFS